MKKKLKAIILSFEDRLAQLQNMEFTRDFQETQDKIKFEEELQRTHEFMQSQRRTLNLDHRSDDDTSSEGENSDDSSSFTHSMKTTVSSFTNIQPSVHESKLGTQMTESFASLNLNQEQQQLFEKRLESIIEEKANHISEILTRNMGAGDIGDIGDTA